MENHGFEVDLTYSKNLTKDWFIQFKGNFWTNENKIIYNDETFSTDDYVFC